MRPERKPQPVRVWPLSETLSPDLVISLRSREYRNEKQLFLCEGIRFLIRAIDSSRPFAGIVYSRQLANLPFAHNLVRRLRRESVPVLDLEPETFRNLAASSESQGVLAVMPQQREPLPRRVGKSDLWLGLDSVRSPGNLGSLFRTAEAAGATGVMCFGGFGAPDPFDPGAVRASMGSIFGVRLVRTSHKQFRTWNLRYDLKVLCADGNAPTDYRLVRYSRPVMFMLGEEREGISEAQRDTCDGTVRIPMSGGLDSLNLAVAGSLLLYEARNQRHPARR